MENFTQEQQHIIETIINKLDLVYVEIKNPKGRDHPQLYSLMDLIIKYVNDAYLKGFKLCQLLQFQILFDLWVQLIQQGYGLKYLLCEFLGKFGKMGLLSEEQESKFIDICFKSIRNRQELQYSCVRAMSLIIESQIQMGKTTSYLQTFEDVCKASIQNQWESCQDCAYALSNINHLKNRINK